MAVVSERETTNGRKKLVYLIRAAQQRRVKANGIEKSGRLSIFFQDDFVGYFVDV